jgi:hypothetical protein
MNNKKRGRPTGYRLSDISKMAISESKKGQLHTQETKNKISRTLMIYFRRLNPLSTELINKYCRSDDDSLCSWITDIREELDEFEDILTDRSMRNTRKTELVYGDNIDYFSHDLTPETILLLKERCTELGIDINDYMDI